MARKYSKGASKYVKRAMRKRKKRTLKSGRSGKTVKSRKQAIAIGLSEARKKGKCRVRRDCEGRQASLIVSAAASLPSASNTLATIPLVSRPAFAYMAAGVS